jgi:hypothetical protein
MDDAQRGELRRLLELTGDSLLEEIGAHLLQYQGMKGEVAPGELPSRTRIIELANEWISIKLPQYRSIVCEKLNWRDKHVEYKDRIDLAAAIVDALASAALNSPVPIAYIAAYLVKMGLDKLCL